MKPTDFILVFQGAIFVVSLVAIVVLIFHRVKKRKKERFEKRDN
jgi:heme exporter protein D